MRFLKGKKRYQPTLDITSLVDVVFLLLIFLLLTMSFAAPSRDSEVEESIIDVNLAESSSSDGARTSESLTVYLDKAGLLYLDSDEAISAQGLKARLTDLDNKEDVSVSLKADRSASHGQVIESLDIIKSAGINRVQLVIEQIGE